MRSWEATKLRFFNYKTKLFVVFGEQNGLYQKYLQNYTQVNEYPWMVVFANKTAEYQGGCGATLVSSLFSIDSILLILLCCASSSTSKSTNIKTLGYSWPYTTLWRQFGRLSMFEKGLQFFSCIITAFSRLAFIILSSIFQVCFPDQ